MHEPSTRIPAMGGFVAAAGGRARWRRSMTLGALVLVATSSGPAMADAPGAPGMPPANTAWDFEVLLDDRPIGSHAFVLERSGPPDGADSTDSAASGWTLNSDARFDVRLLGFSVYRYRHRNIERWRDGCLQALDAHTDDDGSITTVSAQADGDKLDIRVSPGAAHSHAQACASSFAYWAPGVLARQQRLLDPGTGRLRTVRIEKLETRTMEIGGAPVQVRGLRIAGLEHPIDAWYANERWVALDTTVDGGRRLGYRLADSRPGKGEKR